MKIRSGFVSNSSSSSFIIIDDNFKFNKNDNIYEEFVEFIEEHIDENDNFKYTPSSEFGWGPEKFTHWKSKFDWCMLMIYVNDVVKNKYPTYYIEEHQKMYDICYPAMIDFLNDFAHVSNIIIVGNKDIGYIDHQSVEPENCKMMENKKSIYNFIFSNNSCICVQNDNSYSGFDKEGNFIEDSRDNEWW